MSRLSIYLFFGLCLILLLTSAAAAKPDKSDAKRSKKILEENQSKPGVVTLPSGLQYKILKEGKANGNFPSKQSQVKVHYTGTLVDGTKFDSSKDRGEPATFGVTQVIKGWTEMLLLMREGEEVEVYIPSELAYGARPPTPTIPPDAALVFQVELIQVIGSPKKEL